MVGVTRGWFRETLSPKAKAVDCRRSWLIGDWERPDRNGIILHVGADKDVDILIQ